MADTTFLKRRFNTWYLRLVVPADLRAVVGRASVEESLKTGDLRAANAIKFRRIAEIRAGWQRAAAGSAAPRGSADHVIETARAATTDAPLDALRDEVARAHGGDDADIPDELAGAFKYGYSIISGSPVRPLKEAIRDYLAGIKVQVSGEAHAKKQRHLLALQRTLGPYSRPGAVTTKQAADYVRGVLMKNGKSPKSQKDEVSSIVAFWNWLRITGDVDDVNPWANMSRHIPSPVRTKRPYRPAELLALIQGLPAFDPMLPLCALAAYGGFRLSELCDMRLDAIEGDALRVGKSKTENSTGRLLPIHPVVAPIVETLKATSTDGWLISGLLTGGVDNRRSHHVSKKFGRWLGSHGFDTKATDFHSLRRAFLNRCENAAMPLSTAQLLVGHARQSLAYGLYSDGVEFDKLRAAIRLVTYGPEVDAQVTARAPECVIQVRGKRRAKASSAP